MTVGVCWVVLGAVLFGVGTLMQAGVLAASADRSPGAALRHPLFLLGTAAELGGALAHVAALQTVSMALAQLAVSGSLAVTALGTRLIGGARLGAAGGTAIAGLCAALIVLATVSGESGELTDTGTATVVLATATGVLALLGTLLPVLSGHRRVVLSSLLAGLGFAACSIAARLVDTTTMLGALTDPALLVLVAAGGLGAAAWIVALRHGAPTTVTAIVVVSEVVPPSLLGPWLGDELHAAFLLAAPPALIAATVAAVVLARREAAPAVARTTRTGTAPGLSSTGRWPDGSPYRATHDLPAG